VLLILIAELIALSGNLTFALAFVLSRKLENKITPVFQSLIRIIIAFIFFGSLLSIVNAFQYFNLISWNLLLTLCGSIIFTAIIGDILFLEAQKRIGSSKAVAITNTSPLFTFILALIFLNRPITWNLLVSAFSIGIGVFLINKKQHSSQIEDPFEKNKESDKIVGITFSIIVSISWAIGTVFTDYVFTEVELNFGSGIVGMTVSNSIRYLFASIILIFLVIIERKKKPELYPKIKDRKMWGLIVIISVLVNIIGTIIFTETVKIVGASVLSLIFAALPLFTLPLAFLINKEKITKIEFGGILLTILGILIILI